MTTSQAPYTPSAEPPKKQDQTPGLVKLFRKVLKPDMLKKAKMLKDRLPSQELNAALTEQIITPLMPKINEFTRQENNPRYMAYALEHVLNSRALD